MISEHPDDIILLDYVEGMLQGQASDSVRRHIATCRACRRTLAELSDTVSELERLPTAEIPHDALGPGRAGMLRALARFVPVVLAATALVCAILFTRSGAGRRHTATPPATAKSRTPNILAVPATMSRQELHYALVRDGLLRDVSVISPKWEHGLIVVVPDDKVDQARDALAAIAKRALPTGGACTRVVAGQCVGVQVLAATDLAATTAAGERADQIVGATG